MSKLQIKDKNGNLIKLSQDNLEDLYANNYPKFYYLIPNESINLGVESCVIFYSKNATSFGIYYLLSFQGSMYKKVIGDDDEALVFELDENRRIKVTSRKDWRITFIVFQLS